MIPSFLILSAVWFISEVILARKKSLSAGARGFDRSSLSILWITIIISVSLGVYFSFGKSGSIDNDQWLFRFGGQIIIFLGLVIRWNAIIELKRFFTVKVAIQQNHRIVSTGVYRHIRHPAYLGSLISFAGLGLFFTNWISFIIVFIPILASFLYRINVEEKVLVTAFGDEYIEYSERTERLIPWLY